MNAKLRSASDIVIVVVTLVFSYFVVFPEDANAVTTPIATVLELSQAISPWLYLVIAVGIITWGIVRVWGRREVIR
jgi:hypothetical protein